MVKKLLFIYNPISEKIQIKQHLLEILNYFSIQGYLIIAHPVHDCGQAYDLVYEIGKNYNSIVCSGDERLLNEMISGIMKLKCACKLGYITFGNTNGCIKEIGITADWKNALDLSINGKIHSIDIGNCNDRYFLNAATFGMLASASYTAMQKGKSVLGYWGYLLESIRQISDLKSYHLRISYMDQLIEDDFFIGFIANSLTIAGLNNPLNSASALNDGMFDVILIRTPNNLLDLQAIIISLLGNRLDQKYAICFQCKQLLIEGDKIDLTLDGEFCGWYNQLIFRNCYKALQIHGK